MFMCQNWTVTEADAEETLLAKTVRETAPRRDTRRGAAGLRSDASSGVTRLHQLVGVPAADHKGAFDHLTKQITGFLFTV